MKNSVAEAEEAIVALRAVALPFARAAFRVLTEDQLAQEDPSTIVDD